MIEIYMCWQKCFCTSHDDFGRVLPIKYWKSIAPTDSNMTPVTSIKPIGGNG
jgi:hypothetical protein